MSTIIIPSVTLNNGVTVPGIGLGGFGGFSEEDLVNTKGWFGTALKAGYRFIDTAQGYGTEPMLGEAIRESGIPREEITVLTKLAWHRTRDVQKAFDESLQKLGMEYVDIYLLHFPQSIRYEGDIEPTPDAVLKNLQVIEKPDFHETWAEIEKIYESGRAKAIGVSNFSIKTLEELEKTAKITPAINQVEITPYLAQNDLVEYCKKKGIVVMAYSPSGTDKVRNDPTLNALAKKYNTSSNQINMAWNVTRGVIPIPKSTNPTRQKANITLPVLTDEDMQTINALDRNERITNKIGPDGTLFGWTKEQYGW